MIEIRHTLLSVVVLTILTWLGSTSIVLGQQAAPQNIPLNDLSAFRAPGKSWKIVGGVNADLNKQNKLNTFQGTGILVNQPDKRNQGTDLFSNMEHGDINLELDYMMAAGSNSGIYLQGRYELQLEDTWTAKTVKASNNGGIYERWDDSKPERQKGYEGHPPRQNASKAPGLWQHLKISFQAPKFDVSGKKTANARFLRVELNGILIHQNVELSGPTRGSISTDEKASGPLRIQGDHGTVAFRNIQLQTKPNILAESSVAQLNQVDPIFVNAPVNTILRSFIDIDTIRIVHAVSVGSPHNVHYTYDLDKGSIVQVWRGDFLEATAMWHGRGNGTSRPAGAIQTFGKPVLNIASLASPHTAWLNDTIGTGFKIKGYELDDQDRPIFSYSAFGKHIKDASIITNNGKEINRTITLDNPSTNLYVRLAGAAIIEEVNGYYLIADKSYYLRINDAEGAKPIIRTSNGQKELIVPIRSKLSYSILF